MVRQYFMSIENAKQNCSYDLSNEIVLVEKSAYDSLMEQANKLAEVLEIVIAISDRKTNEWDRAKDTLADFEKFKGET